MHLDDTWSGGGRAQALSLDDTATFLRAVQRLDLAPAVESAAKRAMDVTLSTLLLVLAAPVIGLAMLLIRLTSPGPAIFVQRRIGYQGRQFAMLKLRTMRREAERIEDELACEQEGRTFLKLENDPRITRLGRLLRKWSIDELPQLVNVLVGDMSLVGPRPEREHFVKMLVAESPFYEQRLVVRPGLTGWAQIKAPYASSFEESLEKLKYDLYYIKNMSVFLDLSILLSTARTVLLGRGAR